MKLLDLGKSNSFLKKMGAN